MLFIVTALASLAAAASATVIPRADYGAWNVTLTHVGGNDRSQVETVSGVYANAAFADNIPVTCTYSGIVDGVYNPTTTCEPASFSYKLIEQSRTSPRIETNMKWMLTTHRARPRADRHHRRH